jgi:hypothetical protein
MTEDIQPIDNPDDPDALPPSADPVGPDVKNDEVPDSDVPETDPNAEVAAGTEATDG